MNGGTILIAGGDEYFNGILCAQLLVDGCKGIERGDPGSALQAWKTERPSLIVIRPAKDGTWEGLDLAKRVRRRDLTLPIILVSDRSSEERAIAALRQGLNDYFKEPCTCNELMASIHRILFSRSATPKEGTLPDRWHLDDRIVAKSAQMLRVEAYLLQLSATDSNVLISGETGTGKELVAEVIHRGSARRAKPLVRINCAAIPDSLLESELFGYERGAFTGAHTSYDGKLKLADGGTVFFDEIGDMSSLGQAKILRVIENKEVYRLGGRRSVSLDFRVIAATNQSLERLVEQNHFRKDLYYRLNVASVQLPPLRERREDIKLLFHHYVQVYNVRLGRHIGGVTPAAECCLLHYDWPGNVRELKNVVEAIFVSRSQGEITAADLPHHIGDRESLHQEADELERELLLSTLSATQWNKSRAAKKLHWSRMTLYRKIAKHHIENAVPHEAAQAL